MGIDTYVLRGRREIRDRYRYPFQGYRYRELTAADLKLRRFVFAQRIFILFSIRIRIISINTCFNTGVRVPRIIIRFCVFKFSATVFCHHYTFKLVPDFQSFSFWIGVSY